MDQVRPLELDILVYDDKAKTKLNASPLRPREKGRVGYSLDYLPFV